MQDTDFVREVAGVGMYDQPAVGGKAASLGELTQAGIPVPPGYVVTTSAFESALTALDPEGGIRHDIEALPADDSATIARTTAGIRARVEQAPLPERLHRAIADSYRQLARESDGAAAVPVAIRSSATSEDSPDASFAGLQDTYLWVHGEEQVLDYLRKCWASLYTVESVTYRRRRGLAEGRLAMAVVVQRMIDARSAGVMFTRSPTTGDRSVIAVEGSWGLGSGIVSGEVTPDTYLVNKVTGAIVKREISTKRCQHRMDPAGTGVVAEDVPASQQDLPCLSDQEIRALGQLASRVEDHYQAPQDIEWAISRGPSRDVSFEPPADAVIVVLQSRPETAWARRDAVPLATPKGRAFDHVVDMFGGSASTRREGGSTR